MFIIFNKKKLQNKVQYLSKLGATFENIPEKALLYINAYLYLSQTHKY